LAALVSGCSSGAFETNDGTDGAGDQEAAAPDTTIDAVFEVLSEATTDADTEAAPVETEAGDGGACVSGSTRPCNCSLGIEGQESCIDFEWGVCSIPENGVCCSQPGEWVGCWSTGCSVCSDLIAGYPSYWAHHPDCLPIECAPTQRGGCSSACPPPTETDR